MKEIKKILIANRGEIALRIIRTAKDKGIKTVAVYSDADSKAPYVLYADEAIAIGGLSAAESYLSQDKIIAAAKQSGADSIHPGYGFLAENAGFAKRCKAEGLTFIGPSHEAIEKLGSKAGAKEIMRNAGVPVVPGYEGEDQSVGRFKYEAGEIGFPVLLKASAGGGGKGMRIVNNEQELEQAIEAATREAEKSFGDGKLLMEKYFPKAKHIEFQIFGDEHGNFIHMFERECSLQRRYQKVIEEAPSPSLTPELREQMAQAALDAARAVNYTNAGTVEFLLDENNEFYFLEVNTRIQVEHPVTEMTVGGDIVALQIGIAEGKPFPFKQEDIATYGCAIECRICAEDPTNNFLPATGEILSWTENASPLHVRFDTGVSEGSKVTIHYDSMLAKVIGFGHDRQSVITTLTQTLTDMSVLGIKTNISFLKELLQHPSFIDGTHDTKLIEREFSDYKQQLTAEQIHESVIAALVSGWNARKKEQAFPASLNGWRNIFYAPQAFQFELNGETITASYKTGKSEQLEIVVDGFTYQVTPVASISPAPAIALVINSHFKHFSVVASGNTHYVHHPSAGAIQFQEIPRFAEPGAALKKNGYYAPMPGEIVKVLVKPGDTVKSGQRLLIMNSMKMETAIEAHADGVVEEIWVSEKNFVEANTALLKLKEQ